MKVTEKMVEAAARAMERVYHRQSGVLACNEKECWRSMIDFARTGLRAALRRKQSKEASNGR